MEIPSHAVDNNEFGSYNNTKNGASHKINIENNQNPFLTTSSSGTDNNNKSTMRH